MATSPYDPDDHDDSLISPALAAPAPPVFPQPRAIQNFATPAAPATSTVPQADPAPVTPQYQPPAQPPAPKVQSFPAPLAQAAPAAPSAFDTQRGDTPQPQPAAPRPPKVREIPGLEGFDGGEIEDQNDHIQGTLASGQPRQPTYIHQSDEEDAAPPAPSQANQAQAAAQPQQGKAYTLSADGAIQYNPQNLIGGMLNAYRDGLITEDQYKALAPKAIAAQQAIAEQQRIAAGNPAAWKAFASGAAKGTGFLAASAPGAAIGAEIGAFGGPLDPITVPAGGIIGGLISGSLGSLAVDKTMQALGKHSETIQSFVDASQLHPNYDTAGNLVSFAAGLPKIASTGLAVGAEALAGKTTGKAADVLKGTAEHYNNGIGLVGTIKNLAGEDAIRAAQGATTAQRVGAVSAKVGGAMATNVAIDTAIKEGGRALGFSDDHQTWGGAVQAAAVGAFMAGGGIKIDGYNPEQVGKIIIRGNEAQSRGVQIEQALGAKGAEVYQVATAKIAEHVAATGVAPKVSVRQATQNGKPYKVAAAEITTDPSSSAGPASQGNGLSDTPPQLRNELSSPLPTPRESSAPDEGALSAQPSSPESRPQSDSPGPEGKSPSTPSTNAPATGQASTPGDEPTVTRRRGGMSRITRGGMTVTVPTAREAEALDIMRRSAAVASPDPAIPSEPVPDAPAPPSPSKLPTDSGGGARNDAAGVQPAAADQSGNPTGSSGEADSSSAATPAPIHHALADLVNSGATTDHPDGSPSVPFQVLSRLKKSGKTVTPEMADAVTAHVADIMAEPEETRQAALRQLLQDHLAGDDSATSSAPSIPATTFDGVVGEKIDAKRTAFHADSGTLGIPREQMPQVAAEHRGAMAQWLQARGMSFTPEEALPGSLKPSQADFNPAKVEKAAKWAPGSDRRILVSADDHVIDGHHQWMGKLQAEPDKPMQVLRVNAPARDILSQLHEFPSAGMEKAPDLSPRIEASARPGDRPAQREALDWIADQRQQGRDHRELTDDVSKRFGVSRDDSWTLVARQASAEQQSAAGQGKAKGGSRSQPGEPSPAAPIPREPNTEPGRQAQRALDRLTAKRSEQNGFLDAEDRRVLGNAREVVDRDLNRQALGPNPQPTSEVGKAAQRAAQKFADADAAGARLPASDHAAWKTHRSVMESDFTAQRKAIEARAAASPIRPEPANSRPANTGVPTPFKEAAPIIKEAVAAKIKALRDAGQPVPNDLGALAWAKSERFQPEAQARFLAMAQKADAEHGLGLAARGVKLTEPGNATQPGETSASPRAQHATTALEKMRAVEAVGTKLTPSQLDYARRYRADLASEGVPTREQPPLLDAEALDRVHQALSSDAELRQVAQAFGLRGIEAADLGGKESSGIAYRGGKILVDAEGLSDSLSGKNVAKAHEWLRQAIGEEIVHHATLRIPDAQARMESIAQDPASRDLHDFTAKNYAGWDKLDDFQKGAEMVRTAVQKNWRGTITEKVFSAIRDLLSHLHDVLRRIPENSLLKQTVADVESVLREAGARIRGEATGTPAEGSSTPAKASDAFTAKAGGRVTYGRRAATVQNIEGDTATILVKGTKQPVKVALSDLKAPVSRRFVLPGHPTGQPDIIDHIAEAGGMRGSVKGERIARAKGIDTGADYDDRPNLKGVYQNAVFGGSMTPDQMAQHLSEGAPDENGTPTQATFGDGTVGKMYSLIDEAMRGRASAKAELARRATSEKQTDRFQKEALSPDSAKGETQVYARELSPGDKVQIGNQTLKVVAVDPDGVTLEDHTRFGVQHVDEGDKLFVEKVESAQAGDGPTLAAARPRDTGTGHLFGDDEPFDLRGEAAPLLERIAAAKERANAPTPPTDNLPTLRRGENQGDLLSRQSEDLRLVGERGIDYGARQAAQEQADREAAEAKAKQDREQTSLFAAKPGDEQTPDPTRAGSIRELVDETMGTDAPARRRFVQYDTVTSEQAAKLKASTGLDLDGYRRNIDNNAVRHVLKNHGDPAQEISRGNAPLYKEDFERLPELLAQPDASIYGGQNRYGQDIILSAKRVNGYYVVAEEVRDGKRTLNLQTLYKKSAPPLADDAGQGPTPPLTPEAVQSAAQRILHQVASQHNFLHGGGDDPTLAAAKPNIMADDEPSLKEPAPSAGFGARLKEKVSDVADKVSAAREQAAREDRIASLHDAVPTRAGIAGRRAANAVRLDLEKPLDRQAATALVEAGGNRSRLEADLAKVKASANPKLAAEYAPVYQHALDNLPRLAGSLDRYRRIGVNEANAAQQAGIEGTPWQPYVQHVLDDPDLGQSVANEHGLGAVGKFRTYADAIAAGVDPKSMDLADVAERQVRQNRQAIHESEFRATLAGMKASDGKPVLSSIEESTTKLNADGSVSAASKVPKGYEAVQAGDNVLTVHKDFAPILKALFGESAIRQSKLGQAALDLAALAKHGTAMLDSYHAFRVLAKEALGFQTLGYDKGLAALDYAPEDLKDAVKAGRISQQDADFAKAHAATVERGLKAGLNVGRISDNLLEAARQHGLIERLPVVGKGLAKVNELIFGKLTRGAMVQAFTVAEARNRERFSDLSADEVARKSAKEVNEVFGNLGSQGVFKSKTMQDAMKLLLFAPNWSESQLRSEGRAFVQAGKAAKDFVTGKGFRPGVVAQAMATTLFAALASNQALNLVTRGKLTFHNPEDDHKWDAFIPGPTGSPGFFFSPLSIAAEYSHAMMKYMQGGESFLDAAAHVGSNKLSGPARGVKDLVTGEDWKGQKFGSTGERLKAAAIDTLPSPMPASGFLEKDPKSPVGYGWNHQPGSLKKQALGMVGLKVDNAASAKAQVYRLADAFRAKHGGGTGGGDVHGAHGPSAYADLRGLLERNDLKGASGEVRRLVREQGKDLNHIRSALGIKTDGTIQAKHFSGSAKTEKAFVDSLTLEQRKLYFQAQKEHTDIGRRLRQMVGVGTISAPVGS